MLFLHEMQKMHTMETWKRFSGLRLRLVPNTHYANESDERFK